MICDSDNNYEFGIDVGVAVSRGIKEELVNKLRIVTEKFRDIFFNLQRKIDAYLIRLLMQWIKLQI